MVKCSKCGADILEDIKICLACGHTFSNDGVTIKDKLHGNFDFNNLENLLYQIRDCFFKILKNRVESELDANGYRKYFDLFHSSGVYKKFEIKSQQLAKEVHAIHAQNEPSRFQNIEDFLDQTLNDFIDYFVIIHCKDLHKMNLPQPILNYENAQIESLDFKKMVLDFLDFENEKDKSYDGFLNIPANKLENAKAAFLFTENEENLFFLCDQTVFGSCKEGFAMTDKALYWKAHFNDSGKAIYKKLESIQREGEWLTINGQFFNVNRTMNYKMLLLLKKLKTIFF